MGHWISQWYGKKVACQKVKPILFCGDCGRTWFDWRLTITISFVILAASILRSSCVIKNHCYGLFLLGVGTLILAQTAINIGGVLGLIPMTGIPLPFVSYGGTSYLIFSVALGIVIKIIANERRQLNGQYKNSTYILIMIYYCPFLLTLLSSGVQYWIAVNEGKDGTVPALKQLFFIFVGYAGMF